MIVVSASVLKEAHARAAASSVPVPPEIQVALRMCNFWYVVSQPVPMQDDGFAVRQLSPAGELACDAAFASIERYLNPRATK